LQQSYSKKKTIFESLTFDISESQIYCNAATEDQSCLYLNPITLLGKGWTDDPVLVPKNSTCLLAVNNWMWVSTCQMC